MIKIEKVITFIPCLLFFAWYLIAAYANVYACDDFWHGGNVHTYGFWGAQKYYWLNWEGSYMHTFIATLPHIMTCSRMPFWVNILSLCFLIFSFSRFLKSFLVDRTMEGVLSACYLLCAFLLCTSGEEEIRYWVCASSTYLFGISCILLILSNYHQTRRNKRLYVVDILLLGMLAGNKVSFIFTLFVFLTVHDLIFKRLFCSRYKFYISLLALFSLLNIAAPGNFIRLRENYVESEFATYSFLDALCDRSYIWHNLLIMWIVTFPISAYISKYITWRTVMLMIFGFIFVTIGDSMIMYICFHSCGPIRNNVIIELSFMLTEIVAMAFVFQKGRFRILIKYLFIPTLLFFCFLQIKPMSQIEDTYEYSRLANLRDVNVERCASSETILLDSLPDSGLLLSYFCNDVEWLENVYFPYFGKNNKVVLK